MFEAILGTVLGVPVLFLFKNKPKLPPSPAAKIIKTNFILSFKTILKNANFYLLILSFAGLAGNLNCFSTIF